jgi:hypothetical protein
VVCKNEINHYSAKEPFAEFTEEISQITLKAWSNKLLVAERSEEFATHSTEG